MTWILKSAITRSVVGGSVALTMESMVNSLLEQGVENLNETVEPSSWLLS